MNIDDCLESCPPGVDIPDWVEKHWGLISYLDKDNKACLGYSERWVSEHGTFALIKWVKL